MTLHGMRWAVLVAILGQSAACAPGSYDKSGDGTECTKCPMQTYSTISNQTYPLEIVFYMDLGSRSRMWTPWSFYYIPGNTPWARHPPGVSNYPRYSQSSVSIYCMTAVPKCNYTHNFGQDIQEFLGGNKTLSALVAASSSVKFCTDCDSGRFTSSTGITACDGCSAGKYIINNLECANCVMG